MTRTQWIWLTVGALVVAALGRVGQAAAGTITGARAASDVGLLVAVACVGVLGSLALTRARPVTMVLVGLAVATWAMAVARPLWRVGHPRPPLFDGRLGGHQRERPTLPAPVPGRYLIEVEYPGEARAEPNASATYMVHVSAGAARTTIEGVPGTKRQFGEIALARGQTATILLEHSAADYAVVRVRPVPLPWTFLGVLGLVAVAFAFAADLVGYRDRPRLRGALVAAVAAGVIYVLLLDPGAPPTGQAALGAGGLAVVGAGVLGALVSVVENRVYRNRRPRGGRAS